MPAAPIFLSYRRSKCRDTALVLFQLLKSNLDKDTVFLDEESIPPGTKWPDELRQAVHHCHLLLPLIHPDWHKDQEESGERSLHQAGDWVRLELETALKAGKQVVPLLINGAYVSPTPLDPARIVPPNPAWLPEPLQDLFHNQILRYDRLFTSAQTTHLIDDIRGLLPQTGPSSGKKAVDPSGHYANLLARELPLPEELYDQLCHRENPYVGISHFAEAEAPLFFGRDREIWELSRDIFALRPNQILLFHGASGVGKSSLLYAGLFPRLRHPQQGWYVGYERRQKALPLAQQLAQMVKAALQAEETRQLLILDQVEEIITDPGKTDEIPSFVAHLKDTLTRHPALKIILSFRKEYLYDLKKPLKDQAINYREFALHPLDEAGMHRAIQGVFETAAVTKEFPSLKHATQEPAFIEALIADINQDQASNKAPLLQYQLESLYRIAQKQAITTREPLCMTLSLYQAQASTSLASFLEDKKLAEVAADFPEAVKTGLVDDLLYHFTTADLTAATHTRAEVYQRYHHLREDDAQQQRLDKLLQCLVDQYLLLYQQLRDTYRLAHDALARIIRQRYEASPKPGQQAALIIRAKEKLALEKVAFSETDIQLIEEGRAGMYAIPLALQHKLAADAQRYAQQKENRWQLAYRSAQSDYEHLRFSEALANLQLAHAEGIHPDPLADLALNLLFPFHALGRDDQLSAALAFLKDLEILPELPALFSPHDGQAFAAHFPQQWAQSQKSFFPEMKPISGGSFTMGSAEGAAYFPQEGPEHPARVDDFWMGATPITCWQYGLYCRDADQALPSDSGFGRGDRPIINVSWHEAVDYCNWLSEREGLEEVYERQDNETVIAHWEQNGYRLPTEAEWEYAAQGGYTPDGQTRGGQGARFGNGKALADPADMNFDGAHSYNTFNKEVSGWSKPGIKRGQTTPVAGFAPSPLGLYDLSGNVFGWCWDWYEESYYAQNPPKDNPHGPESKQAFKVVRGGSWLATAIYCRSSFRVRVIPIGQNGIVGFRVVRRLAL